MSPPTAERAILQPPEAVCYFPRAAAPEARLLAALGYGATPMISTRASPCSYDTQLCHSIVPPRPSLPSPKLPLREATDRQSARGCLSCALSRWRKRGRYGERFCGMAMMLILFAPRGSHRPCATMINGAKLQR